MIQLTVVSFNNEVPQQPLTAVFGTAGGTLGRGADNHLILPDPKRHVSRLQASVFSDGRCHTIVNLSQANSLMVSGHEVAANQEMAFAPGDHIIVGLFVLLAEAVVPSNAVDQSDTVYANKIAQAAPPVEQYAESPNSATGNAEGADFGGILSNGLALSRLSEGLGQDFILQEVSTSATEVISESVAAASAYSLPLPPVPPHASVRYAQSIGFDDLLKDAVHGPAIAAHGAAVIPDNFDPFAMPSYAVRNSEDPLGALAHNAVTLASFEDRMLGSLIETAADTPVETLLQADPDTASVDPLQLFGESSILSAPEPASAHSVAMRNDVQELDTPFLMPIGRLHLSDGAFANSHVMQTETSVSASFGDPTAVPDRNQAATAAAYATSTPMVLQVESTLPQKVEQPTSPMRPDQNGVAEVAANDRRLLLQAFLAGADLPEDAIMQELTPDLMRLIGQILASATQGTVELISSRAFVKREVRADVTMIVVRNNNPLKFLPDGQTALMQMFGRKIPGFMEPVAAMDDAYRDLRAHQIGVVAGMRAALDDVLQRFDPARLEQHISGHSILDAVLPVSRKARMWDHYGKLFRNIQAEAQDDFQSLFGKAFLAAYEEEIERFNQESTQ